LSPAHTSPLHETKKTKIELVTLKNVFVEFEYEVLNKATEAKIAHGWTKLGAVDKHGEIIVLPEIIMDRLEL